MNNSDRLYLSKFSLNADDESFLEEDDFQEFESDDDIDQILDGPDFDEMADYFRDKNQLNGNSNRIYR
jgi:hypothetical protein